MRYIREKEFKTMNDLNDFLIVEKIFKNDVVNVEKIESGYRLYFWWSNYRD